MAESVGVIVATFGDFSVWHSTAQRALASVERQTQSPDSVVFHHGRSLASARNEAAKAINTDWLIFLDADDELDERYIEASLEGFGDIRQPSTLGVRDGIPDDQPYLLPEQSLIERNYVVVGAMQRRDKFLAAGGFSEMPALEDWELWLRLVLYHEAVIYPCPRAIYRVTQRADSRNENAHKHGQCYVEVRKKHQPSWERR